ncbi:GntR family transcriptional regulator [Acidovorax sp. JHL-9]|uniref:GntR family transcriptional regulator n=1 Tax=Acidovorax sp. JHL-9 TaxID=1276756 RepID=UPI0009DB82E1|nr:GntR family transcriptional regulator [Acidovorax sp. JHL-9]
MTPEKPIPLQLLEMAHSQQWPAGTHLGAQRLADQLRVSRSPVNDALALLHDKGVLVREPNRGYFLARPVDKPVAALAESLGLEAEDQVTAVYFELADDRLRGQLPDEFTETLIKQRYRLTPAQLNTLLSRMANEGWIEKRPGYGWAFSSMLTTSDSLLQSYRLRLALEPAALMEPGYRLDPQVIARCRAAEQHLLDGGIETDTADQLHERGVRFHESLVEASGNPFFIDTIRRVNRVRRLLSYRSMKNRQRYREHCNQHLEILGLIERERQTEAAEALRTHLQSTLRNLEQIAGLLQGAPAATPTATGKTPPISPSPRTTRRTRAR